MSLKLLTFEENEIQLIYLVIILFEFSPFFVSVAVKRLSVSPPSLLIIKSSTLGGIATPMINISDPLTSFKINHFKKILEILQYQRIEKLSNEKTVSYLNALSIGTLTGAKFTVAALKAIKKSLANPFTYKETTAVKFALFLISTKELTIEQMLLLQEPRYKKQTTKESI